MKKIIFLILASGYANLASANLVTPKTLVCSGTLSPFEKVVDLNKPPTYVSLPVINVKLAESTHDPRGSRLSAFQTVKYGYFTINVSANQPYADTETNPWLMHDSIQISVYNWRTHSQSWAGYLSDTARTTDTDMISIYNQEDQDDYWSSHLTYNCELN